MNFINKKILDKIKIMEEFNEQRFANQKGIW